jgi:putative DNA primase/helicase
MLQTAASEVGMGIGSMLELDRDPMLLGCKNGVIDLEHGTLLMAMPAMLITRQASANLDYSAKCPNWLNFLDQCFIGDKEMIAYMQKALGYSLTGLVSEEVLHFCFGMGRNGKSVFANVINKIMGDYAITAPAEMLMRRDRNGVTNDVARLCGSRLVLANETRSDQRFDDLMIKTLVSTEQISARFLHSEFFEFWPTFKIWIRGNHKPVITDDSNGAWRRIRLIPFENNIPEEIVDINLENKLLAEKDGILLWMVEGASKWKKEGLSPSQRIRSASNQYRADCDILGEFIDDGCSVGEGLKTSQAYLWTLWQQWARDNGYFHGSKKTFTRRLKDRGINADGYDKGVRAYIGITPKIHPL